jgi:hypothetical protein
MIKAFRGYLVKAGCTGLTFRIKCVIYLNPCSLGQYRPKKTLQEEKMSSESAYRVAAVLYAANLSGESELLLPEIVHKTGLSYQVVRYWIGVFEIQGFIRVDRYAYRENVIKRKNRHVVVCVKSRRLARLYSSLWTRGRETDFVSDLWHFQGLRLCLAA